MGLFGSRTSRIVRELRHISEYYSNDLGRDIKESFEDLKSDYDESAQVVPELIEFINELRPKLDSRDAGKLDALSQKLLKVQRSAKNGVEAMYELSRSQRKLTMQNLRDLEALES